MNAEEYIKNYLNTTSGPKPCPHCGQPMPGSTPAQPAALPTPAPVVPPPLPVPITKTNESWHDRPPLT